MRYGVIWHPASTNLGDDMQTLAASRLLPRVDGALDGERSHCRAGYNSLFQAPWWKFPYYPQNHVLLWRALSYFLSFQALPWGFPLRQV